MVSACTPGALLLGPAVYPVRSFCHRTCGQGEVHPPSCRRRRPLGRWRCDGVSTGQRPGVNGVAGLQQPAEVSHDSGMRFVNNSVSTSVKLVASIHL